MVKVIKTCNDNKTACLVFAVAVVLLLGAAPGPGAQDLSFSASTWSFFEGAGGYRPADPGCYGEIGVTVGLTPRIEADLGLIGSITPSPANTLFFNAGISYSLVGKRYIDSEEPTGLFSMLLTAGVMEGFHDVWQSGAPMSTSTHLYLKLTPFSVGSLYYGKRDRCFSIGIQYDIGASSWSLFTNIIASDIFLAKFGNSR